MRTLRRLITAATVVASATALAVGTAAADPITNTGKRVTPKATDVVGVGSDTIQNLLDQFSIDYNTSHSRGPRLYSWDATNPRTGAVHDTILAKKGCAPAARPNGSTEGILATAGGPLALTSNTKTGTHFCSDFARSSRGRAIGDPGKVAGGIVFVSLGKDAVTYSTNATTNAPGNLTDAQLAAIYTCTDTMWTQVGGSSSDTIVPQLPQTGSGTRAFFLKAINVTTPGSCVNSTAEENEGVNPVLKGPDVIFPYSIGKYIAEKFHSAKCLNKACTPVSGKVCKPSKTQNRFGCDTHGTMVLHSINGTQPTTGTGTSTVINKKFTPNFVRLVYIVVRFASTADNIPRYLEPFFAAKFAKHPGWTCTSKKAHQDLINYGFLPTPLCGTGS